MSEKDLDSGKTFSRISPDTEQPNERLVSECINKMREVISHAVQNSFLFDISLRQLQGEQKEWVRHNFPNAKPYHPLLGVCEEAGELCHAHLKREQGIRENENHIENAKDAVADIIIFLADYCTKNDIDLQDCLNETWPKVKQRNWRKGNDV